MQSEHTSPAYLEPIRQEDFRPVGYIRKPHGLSGEMAAETDVDLEPLLEDPDEPLTLMVEREGLLIPFRLNTLRERGNSIDLLTFKRIESKEEAEKLRGAKLFLHKDYFGENETEESNPLPGYTVVSTRGEQIGLLKMIDRSTINTLYEVEAPDGRILLLPAAEGLVTGIDHDNSRVTLIIPEGLLDL